MAMLEDEHLRICGRFDRGFRPWIGPAPRKPHPDARLADMKRLIRTMAAADHRIWVKLRGALLPEESRQSHVRAIDQLCERRCLGFCRRNPDCTALGFA